MLGLQIMFDLLPLIVAQVASVKQQFGNFAVQMAGHVRRCGAVAVITCADEELVERDRLRTA